VRANQDAFPVGVMCRLLEVSTSGFYDWQDRPMSRHARRDVELSALIHATFERSQRTYGSRRVYEELRDDYGVRVARSGWHVCQPEKAFCTWQWCSMCFRA
jgi:putative transposase